MFLIERIVDFLCPEQVGVVTSRLLIVRGNGSLAVVSVEVQLIAGIRQTVRRSGIVGHLSVAGELHTGEARTACDIPCLQLVHEAGPEPEPHSYRS